MALLGISESLGVRGIQNDLKIGVVASAGTLFRLGSGDSYLLLGSNQVSHILDADVTAAGLTAADVLFGIQNRVTKVDDPALTRPLAPGDTFRTDQLLSTGSQAVDGTTVPNTALAVDPATGKIRLKQATDAGLLRLAPDGGNLYNTDGSIWVQVENLE